MWPRKRILLYEPDEERGALAAYTLELVLHVRVSHCRNQEAFMALLNDPWDGVILSRPVEAVEKAVMESRLDHLIYRGDLPIGGTEFIENVRHIIRVKRGPKAVPYIPRMMDVAEAPAQLAREKAKVPASAPALAGTLLRGQHA